MIEHKWLETPEWGPLVNMEVVEPQCQPEQFMFMGVSISEDRCIYKYKHKDTRHYLNIDKDGKCYLYSPFRESYQPIKQADAVRLAINL